jgi:integrase
MPRAYPHTHLCHGQLVGFSVKRRANEPSFFAYFRSPDGRRLERDTNQMRLAQAIEAARLIIEKEFAPAPNHPNKVTWDEAVERLTVRLQTSGNRASTTGYYLKVIRLLRKMYSVTDGPADISPGMAAAWRDKMMTTLGKRNRPPSAHYVAGLIIGLSSLWQKWFMDDLKIVAGNPWQDVTPPKADKLAVKYATDELITPFYAWVAGRFGSWPFPKLFLTVKACTGCRLMDLCSLRSAQLHGGKIVFPAELTKGRKERAVPLPTDVYASLDAIKGETWLWESYPSGLKAALKAKGYPTHQLNPEFSPQRLYFWVETLFSDYRKTFPDRPRLTSHMFRKRAFTKAWDAGVDPRRAAIAIGCNVDTMMQHYVAMDEQQVTDDVFARLNAPPAQPTAQPKKGPKKGGGEEE